VTASADSRIGAEGARLLADALKVNTTLQLLALGGVSACSLAALR
jgi:hypothetical protein